MKRYVYTSIVLFVVFSSSGFNNGTRKVTPEEAGPLNPSNQRQTVQVTPGGSPDELWKAFCLSVPTGVTNLSVSTTTAWAQMVMQWGIYKNLPPINNVQMKDGIVLTSGKAADCVGPNNSGSKTTEFGYPGDADLVAVVGENVFDAATLVIDFTADATVKGISFDFCFGTEEYPEYVGQFNDAFICLLDGRNICFDGSGKIISVNNAFFGVVNTPNPTINLQWDGFTYVLKTSKPITVGKHTLKFAIGDTRDGKLDAGVFLSNFKFSIDDTGTIPIVDLIKDQTFSVLEKSPSQTYVGKVINLIKKKEVSLEVMTPAKEFDIATGAWIDTNSWPITVANGAVLDIKIQKQYIIPVRASFKISNGFKYDTANMTINLLPNSSWPAIKNAVIFDQNGNGIGDSIGIEFVDVVPDSVFKCKTTDFPWPEVSPINYSVPFTTKNIYNKKYLAFSYDPTAGAQVYTKGKSTIQVKLDSAGTQIIRLGDLNDGIGPVLAEARVVKRFKPMDDTFRVRISEPVNMPVINGKSFILIKKGHVKEIEIEPIAGTLKDLENETYIQFLVVDLGVDAPAEGDSLKILYTGPVIDKVGIKAHKNNPPVPIKFVDGMLDPWPQISTAVIYDKNGDGKGDSVRVEFASEIVKQITSKRADFTWPANLLKYSVNITNNDFINNRIIPFSFVPDASATVWTSGKSSISVFCDSMQTEISRTSDLLDGIGPLLTEASVIKRYVPQNDTFRVKITEPVTVPAIAGNSFILIKKGHIKEIEIAPIGAVKDLSGEAYIQFAVVDLGADAPAPGDSLKILYTGPVADKVNNKAHKDNTPVPIKFIDNNVPVKNAYYYDVNGDGIVDRVRAEFADTLKKLDSIAFDVTWTDIGESGRVTGASFETGSKSIVVLDLTNIFANKDKIRDKTSGDMTLTLTYSSTQSSATYAVTDKAGPVITRAIYYFSRFTSARNAEVDTLSVTFSEGVNAITSDRPFLLETLADLQYYFVMNPNPTALNKNKVLFTIKSTEGVKNPVEGDSIWINANEGVKDNSDNAQAVKDNKKVLLELRTPPFDLTPYVIGPKGPGEKTIPPDLKISKSIDTGTIIMLEPNIYVPRNVLDKVTCSIKIFDALGNFIASCNGYTDKNGLIEMGTVQGKSNSYIVINWADANSSQRSVGSATYIGFIEYTLPDGQTYHKKLAIPIKE